MKQGLVAWTWETHGRFAAGGEGSCGEQCPRPGRPRPATAHSTLIPETMMVGLGRRPQAWPCGPPPLSGGCGLDRAGPVQPPFHHRNEGCRVAVSFQINQLREKACSPRGRDERMQGSPRSLDQRRNSEKKLTQHLTETPSCEALVPACVLAKRAASTGPMSISSKAFCTSARPSSVKIDWFRSTRRRWPPYADTPGIAIRYFRCQGIQHFF